jgi:hypothetical protein
MPQPVLFHDTAGELVEHVLDLPWTEDPVELRSNSCAECGYEGTGIARVALKQEKSARPLDVRLVRLYQMRLAYAHFIQCGIGQRDLERLVASLTEELGAMHHDTLLALARLCLVLLVQRKFEDAMYASRALYDAAMANGSRGLIRLGRDVLASVSVTMFRETKKVPPAEVLLEARLVVDAPTAAPAMRLMVGLLYGQRRFYEAAYYAAKSFRRTVAALDGAVLLRVNGRIGPGATCAACGARDPKPKRCAGCRTARYCDPACQRAHRADHRASCSARGPKVVTAPRAVMDTEGALRTWLALT